MRAFRLLAAFIPVLALSSCALLPAQSTDVTHLPKGVQSPFTNTGPAKDQAAVQASLVHALSTQEDQLARTDQGTPRQTTAVRAARLRSVESAKLAKSDCAALSYLTATDTPFRSSHFQVICWQGVAVRGKKAKAYVLGHNIYAHWDGSTRTDAEFQYKALLQRDPHAPHRWILTHYRAASDNQG